MRTKRNQVSRIVLCIENEGNEVSLQRRKLYRTVPDSTAEALGMIRVIDEENEDYLYSKDWFVPMKLPVGAAGLFDEAPVRTARGNRRVRTTSRS